MRSTFFVVAVCLLSASLIFAQEECPLVVEEALETVQQNCSNLARNVACYGNGDISASLRSDASFSAEGDTVDLLDIEDMTLAPFDAANEVWGISLLNAQANLPNTIPGQLVSILLFGDVQVQNAVAPVEEITVTANANTRLRNSPSSTNDLNIITGVSAGETMSANGRIESGEWLRVSYRDNLGWIAAVGVDGDSERMSLPVVDVADAYLRPMQAFYLTTGIGVVSCGDVPESGVLVQTPEGAGTVELTVNGVSIRLGSTIYLQTRENSLQVALLEGTSTVFADGVYQFLPAGTFVEVPLSEDGHSPIAAPSFPAPYDASLIQPLADTFFATENPVLSPVEVAEPMPSENVEAAIVETYADSATGLIAGWYRVSVISFEQVVPNPFTNGYCASGGTALNYLNTEFSTGFDWSSIEVESLTSFTFTVDSSASDLGGCIVEHRAVWTSTEP